jgi:hypothetical protein
VEGMEVIKQVIITTEKLLNVSNVADPGSGAFFTPGSGIRDG